MAAAWVAQEGEVSCVGDNTLAIVGSKVGTDAPNWSILTNKSMKKASMMHFLMLYAQNTVFWPIYFIEMCVLEVWE